MQDEITIVGGGVHGVAVAWELARRGSSVTLLEANQVGGGASGGLGKRGVRANGRDVRELPLMAVAYEIWAGLDAELRADTGYERTGHLRLYEQDHDRADAEMRAEFQSRYGVPTEHLDANAVQAIEPGVGPVVRGALHCPCDGVADHEATTHAYADAARRAGAEIREGARVHGLMLDQGRCQQLDLGQRESMPTQGPVLLLANGGVPDLVWRSSGVSLPVWDVYPQVVVSTPADDPPVRTLVGHAGRRLSAKMISGGAVMLSGGWRGAWNPQDRKPELVRESVEGNWAQAVAVFPSIASLSIAVATADRAESVCLDDIPIIDRMPDVSNVFIATGWSGHGWAIAPAVARLLSDWVLEGRRPNLLEPFRLNRFFRGRRES